MKDEAHDDGNQGMAAVMAKILGRGTGGVSSTKIASQSVIMSKAITEKQSAARKRKHLDKTSQVSVCW